MKLIVDVWAQVSIPKNLYFLWEKNKLKNHSYPLNFDEPINQHSLKKNRKEKVSKNHWRKDQHHLKFLIKCTTNNNMVLTPLSSIGSEAS